MTVLSEAKEKKEKKKGAEKEKRGPPGL